LTASGPEHGLRDVVAREGFHAVVNFGGFCGVAVKAHKRKLRLRHARFDAAHAHSGRAGGYKFGAQIECSAKTDDLRFLSETVFVP